MKWITAGPAAASQLGYCPVDYTHLSLAHFLTPGSLAILQQVAAEELEADNLWLYQGMPFWTRSLVLEHVRKDGIRLWMDTRLTFLQPEQRPIVILVSSRQPGVQPTTLDPEQLRIEAALKETASALSVLSDLDDILDRILANTQKIVPNDNANIMLVEDGIARIVRYLGSYSESEKQAIFAQDLQVDQITTLHQMQETGKPLLVADTHGHPLWSYVPSGGWIRSYVAAPVRIKNLTLGFINLNSPCPGFFTPLHAQQLQAFADQAALAIDHARMFRDLQRQMRRSLLLNDITRMAISAPHLDAMLRILADRLSELLSAEGAVLSLWEENRQKVRPAAAYGHFRHSAGEISLHPEEEKLLLAALESGSVLQSTPVPLLTQGSETAAGAMLALPLEADGHRLGAALLCYTCPHVFSADDISLAGQAAAQISLALYKAQLLEAERSRSQRLARARDLILALGNVAARLQSVSSIDGIMCTLGEELKKLGVYCLMAYAQDRSATPPENLHVFYLNRDEDPVYLPDTDGKGCRIEHSITRENFPLFDEVIRRQQPVFVPDWDISVAVMKNLGSNGSAEAELRSVNVTPQSRHFYLPLMTDHAVFGMLWMWGENLEQSDLPAASAFAGQVSIALENARLYTEVKRLSITDPLTGLYNRRGMAEFGAHEIERANRFSRPLSLILLDIDHFKVLNDQFGHAAGDQFLKSLAQIGREAIRSTDIFVRYGGEEFIVLLPETGQPAAGEIAERLRAAVEQMEVFYCGNCLQATISLGISTLTGPGDCLESLLLAADGSLYRAKHSGRNCVRVS